MKAFGNFSANKANRRGQSFQGKLCFLVISLYGDVDSRGTGIVRQLHAANSSQADARIAEFALKDRKDFLAQGFAQPSAMVLGSPALDHFTPE